MGIRDSTITQVFLNQHILILNQLYILVLRMLLFIVVVLSYYVTHLILTLRRKKY